MVCKLKKQVEQTKKCTFTGGEKFSKEVQSL